MNVNGREYRQVIAAARSFIVRAQDYMIRGYDGIERQQTRIEVLDYCRTLWAKDRAPLLLGVLTEESDPFNADPQLQDIPVFTPTSNLNYHIQTGIYHGAVGLLKANEILARMSELQLSRAIEHYILGSS
jgi:hypothetical protein